MKKLIVATFIFACIGLSIPVYGVEIEPEDKKDTQVEKILHPETDIYAEPKLTNDEVDLIALVALGEAENQSELGKRLVIDTILNRIDSDVYPDTVTDVCYQKGQFGCLHNGRCKRCKVTDNIRDLVRQEEELRTNSEVMYFNTGNYNGRTPLLKEGAHYFSGR